MKPRNLFRLVKTTSPHGNIRSAETHPDEVERNGQEMTRIPDGMERNLQRYARGIWDDFSTYPTILQDRLTDLNTDNPRERERLEEIIFLLRPDINRVAEMGDVHVKFFLEYLREQEPEGDDPNGGRHLLEALGQMTRESFNRSRKLRGLLGQQVQDGVPIHLHFMEDYIEDLAESIERTGAFPAGVGTLFDKFLPIHMNSDGGPSLTEPVAAAAARRAAREGTFFHKSLPGYPNASALAAHLLRSGREPFPRVADMAIRKGFVTGREGMEHGLHWIIDGAAALHQDGNLPESWRHLLRAAGRLPEAPPQ